MKRLSYAFFALVMLMTGCSVNNHRDLFYGVRDGKFTRNGESICFIGANSNLVAPLNLGDGTFVAAGTTVTRDTESGSFVIGRVRQEGREGGNPLRKSSR